MTSIINYAVAIALALVIAAGASLIYVLYVHTTTPPTTPSAPAPTPTTPTQPTPSNTSTHTPRTTTTTVGTQSRVLNVVLYVSPPNVTKCAEIGSDYVYYFNITVERTRPEDPVTVYNFKAVTQNATLDLQTASVLALEREYFKPYLINETQRLGVLNIYLELRSSKPLDIREVSYLGVNYTINRYVYVTCIKNVKLSGAYNQTLPGPGVLGLVPTDRTFTVEVRGLPRGSYRIAAPPDVVAPREVTATGNKTDITLGLLNKPLVFNPLPLNLTKVG
ncbi:hypothetical protein [Pyrobaculum ferrireducens]|uniref:Uncharacterized protein n=1 Tax=Pyrobaculum ferrireducens TaxID=1104324 RepID=G7VG29_9CREN|nr:hypothetical protein [Pyrobaculum ferrireducens]AET33027.1 hypothetical protein P186_1611 [Pyrobaculum ferrireducens]